MGKRAALAGVPRALASCLLLAVSATAVGSGDSLLVLLSQGLNGEGANGGSFYPAVDHAGDIVAFRSLATNLVPNDDNRFCGGGPDFPPSNCGDVFRWHATTPHLEIVSVAWTGTGANGSSDAPAVNSDGSVVAFVSLATNLVPDDTNGLRDVFVRDFKSGKTVRASVSTQGLQQERAPGSDCSRYCGDVSINGAGTMVVFDSWSSNLVIADTNQQVDVFVRDLSKETTERVSVSSLGVEGNGPSWMKGRGAISDDRRFVVFQSKATNLVDDDTNGATDIFLRDRELGRTLRVSVSPTGIEGNADSNYPAISGDGAVVAFASSASNLVAGDTNGVMDIFLFGVKSGTLFRLSAAQDQPNGASSWPSVSRNGARVAFQSDATNLLAGVATRPSLSYIWDATHGIRLASVGISGQHPNGLSVLPSISGDGQAVAFWSAASNLFPADENGREDVFLVPNVEALDSVQQEEQTSPNETSPAFQVWVSIGVVMLALLVKRRRPRRPLLGRASARSWGLHPSPTLSITHKSDSPGGTDDARRGTELR